MWFTFSAPIEVQIGKAVDVNDLVLGESVDSAKIAFLEIALVS